MSICILHLSYSCQVSEKAFGAGANLKEFKCSEQSQTTVVNKDDKRTYYFLIYFFMGVLRVNWCLKLLPGAYEKKVF